VGRVRVGPFSGGRRDDGDDPPRDDRMSTVYGRRVAGGSVPDRGSTAGTRTVAQRRACQSLRTRTVKGSDGG